MFISPNGSTRGERAILSFKFSSFCWDREVNVNEKVRENNKIFWLDLIFNIRLLFDLISGGKF